MRRGGWVLLLAALASCGPPSNEELLKRIEADPGDVEAGAYLAIAGRAMAPGLIRLLEQNMGSDERSTRIRKTCCSILFVAGNVCASPCAEYMSSGESHQVRYLLLKVMGEGRWRLASRKLANRIGDDPATGPAIYQCLARIHQGEKIPDDPWAVEEPLRTERLAEWSRWVGQNVQEFVRLDGPESQYKSEHFEMVRKMVQGEIDGPRFR